MLSSSNTPTKATCDSFPRLRQQGSVSPTDCSSTFHQREPSSVLLGTTTSSSTLALNASTVLGDDAAVLRDYIINCRLGEGGYGTVYAATHQRTNQRFAIKMIPRVQLSAAWEKMILNEATVMQELRHPHVVQFFRLLRTSTHLCLVMDLADGGELFDLIVQSQRFSEHVARRYFQQLLSAIYYCHEKRNVAHRDLKAENLLLDRMGNLMVCDFGFSCKGLPVPVDDPDADDGHSDGRGMLLPEGTLHYMSPEALSCESLLQRCAAATWNGDTSMDPLESTLSATTTSATRSTGYYFQQDLWASGCILYFMLAGRLPFDGRDDEETMHLITQCTINWNLIPQEGARQFLKRILCKDAMDRFTLREMITHEWFTKDLDIHGLFPDVAFPGHPRSPTSIGARHLSVSCGSPVPFGTSTRSNPSSEGGASHCGPTTTDRLNGTQSGGGLPRSGSRLFLDFSHADEGDFGVTEDEEHIIKSAFDAIDTDGYGEFITVDELRDALILLKKGMVDNEEVEELVRLFLGTEPPSTPLSATLPSTTPSQQPPLAPPPPATTTTPHVPPPAVPPQRSSAKIAIPSRSSLSMTTSPVAGSPPIARDFMMSHQQQQQQHKAAAATAAHGGGRRNPSIDSLWPTSSADDVTANSSCNVSPPPGFADPHSMSGSLRASSMTHKRLPHPPPLRHQQQQLPSTTAATPAPPPLTSMGSSSGVSSPSSCITYEKFRDAWVRKDLARRRFKDQSFFQLYPLANLSHTKCEKEVVRQLRVAFDAIDEVHCGVIGLPQWKKIFAKAEITVTDVELQGLLQYWNQTTVVVAPTSQQQVSSPSNPNNNNRGAASEEEPQPNSGANTNSSQPSSSTCLSLTDTPQLSVSPLAPSLSGPFRQSPPSPPPSATTTGQSSQQQQPVSFGITFEDFIAGIVKRDILLKHPLGKKLAAATNLANFAQLRHVDRSINNGFVVLGMRDVIAQKLEEAHPKRLVLVARADRQVPAETTLSFQSVRHLNSMIGTPVMMGVSPPNNKQPQPTHNNNTITTATTPTNQSRGSSQQQSQQLSFPTTVPSPSGGIATTTTPSAPSSSSVFGSPQQQHHTPSFAASAALIRHGNATLAEALRQQGGGGGGGSGTLHPSPAVPVTIPLIGEEGLLAGDGTAAGCGAGGSGCCSPSSFLPCSRRLRVAPSNSVVFVCSPSTKSSLTATAEPPPSSTTSTGSAASFDTAVFHSMDHRPNNGMATDSGSTPSPAADLASTANSASATPPPPPLPPPPPAQPQTPATASSTTVTSFTNPPSTNLSSNNNNTTQALRSKRKSFSASSSRPTPQPQDPIAAASPLLGGSVVTVCELDVTLTPTAHLGYLIVRVRRISGSTQEFHEVVMMVINVLEREMEQATLDSCAVGESELM